MQTPWHGMQPLDIPSYSEILTETLAECSFKVERIGIITNGEAQALNFLDEALAIVDEAQPVNMHDTCEDLL